jgi:Flp pilus assembly protein TadG
MSTHGHPTPVTTFAPERSGSTAVEFALLCPLYLFLILGMTAYGVYFGAAHSVQQISADAARAAVAGVSMDERRALASGFVSRHADGYLFIELAKVSVELNSQPDATQFNVVVSYDASDLPIWGLFDRLSMPSKVIQRRSTIRIGGI